MPNSETDRQSILTKILRQCTNFWQYLTDKQKRKDTYAEILNKVLDDSSQTDSMSKLILTNYAEFINKTVADILIPRSDIFGIKSTTTIEGINQAPTKRFHTRIIVYEDNLDNIVGFIHIKDLYKNLVLGEKLKPMDLIRKPLTVVNSTKLVKLLAQMQQNRTHLAIVVDEYGGTEGIVTNEDIIRALVGDQKDELDNVPNNNDEYELINDTTLIINARAEIEKVEELLKIELNKDKYDCETIGGLVICIANKVPSINSCFKITENVEAEVIEANKRFLKKIKVKVLKTDH